LNDGVKVSDEEIRKLLDSTFKEYPRLMKELHVRNGEVTTKLGVCEEVFFTFKEMVVALYKFVKKYKALFRYGEWLWGQA